MKRYDPPRRVVKTNSTMEPGTPRHEDSLAKRVSDFISGGLLWICCVGFLNPRGEGSAEYYTILDIEKHASHDEVKAAFRRKSLHYHPDKLRQRNETLTDDSCEAYRKIKVAYEVLSNPHRRHTYDTLGINGLMLEEVNLSIHRFFCSHLCRPSAHFLRPPLSARIRCCLRS